MRILPMEDEARRKDEKPIVDVAAATAIIAELYGLTVVPSTLKELDSYDDRNFWFRAPAGKLDLEAGDCNSAGSGAYHFVLKVHNGVESQQLPFIEAQNLAMERIRANGLWAPRAIRSLASGVQIEKAERPLASGTLRQHAVRLLPFRPGRLLGDVPPTVALLQSVGAYCARVDVALEGFAHPAASRGAFMWDLAQCESIGPLLAHLPAERRLAVDSVLADFRSTCLPLAPSLRRAVIHGDMNDQNLLVDEGGTHVVGVIDFGDLVETWRVNELAITAAYALIYLQYERGEQAEPPPSCADAMRAVVGRCAPPPAARPEARPQPRVAPLARPLHARSR